MTNELSKIFEEQKQIIEQLQEVSSLLITLSDIDRNEDWVITSDNTQGGFGGKEILIFTENTKERFLRFLEEEVGLLKKEVRDSSVKVIDHLTYEKFEESEKVFNG